MAAEPAPNQFFVQLYELSNSTFRYNGIRFESGDLG